MIRFKPRKQPSGIAVLRRMEDEIAAKDVQIRSLQRQLDERRINEIRRENADMYSILLALKRAVVWDRPNHRWVIQEMDAMLIGSPPGVLAKHLHEVINAREEGKR